MSKRVNIEENKNSDFSMRTMTGLKEYMAPEMLAGKKYNEKVDIWGIGLLLYLMLTGRNITTKENVHHIHTMNENGKL